MADGVGEIGDRAPLHVRRGRVSSAAPPAGGRAGRHPETLRWKGKLLLNKEEPELAAPALSVSQVSYQSENPPTEFVPRNREFVYIEFSTIIGAPAVRLSTIVAAIRALDVVSLSAML
jgi:hypothetical protein